MRAAVCDEFGPPEVIRTREMPDPVPGAREVCVAVSAAAVTSSDCLVRGFQIKPSMRLAAHVALGFHRPRHRVLGMVFAGSIASRGVRAARFEVGQRVVGFDRYGFGAYGELKTMSADGVIAAIPKELTDEHAAAFPYGGLLALYVLRRGKLAPGQRVMVYGASSAVGTSAVQIAKAAGADVTAVCGPTNATLVASLGADRVLDYTRDDVLHPDKPYDLVAVTVGDRWGPPSRAEWSTALLPGGVFSPVDSGTPRLRAEDLEYLLEMAARGELAPAIDRTYSLDQAAEAHRYVETGHKRGNVLLRIARD